MALTLSTSGVHPRDRANYWRDEIVGNLAQHDFRSSVGPDYRGEITLHMLSDVKIAAIDADPCELERTQKHLASCTSDDLIFYLQLCGNSIMGQDGRHVELKDGSLTLLDASRTCVASHRQRTRNLNIAVPRRALEARLGSASALTASRFDPLNPVFGLATGFIALLPERIPSLDAANSAKIAEQVVDLLALACTSEQSSRSVTLSTPRALGLLRLKSAIEARLSDPELRPAAAAAIAGISIRYANSLLAEEGTSVERYILRRRLERCRSALEDPTQSSRTIGEIAYGWGFSDISHFGRRFKAEYGLAPTDYRQDAISNYTHAKLPRLARRAHLSLSAANGTLVPGE
jgi:AraC-like DNA-binding protein